MLPKTIRLVVLLFISFQGFGSHFSSGEIYYKWSPIATDSSRYEVFVNWFRNNGGIPISQTTAAVCITSSCFPNINLTLNRIMPPPGLASPNDNDGGWLVTGIDDCADPTDPAYKDLSVHKFSGFVSLPGVCGDFKFSVSPPCCRDQSTNLSSSPNLYIEASLNNTLGENSSPEILSQPGVGFCVQGINDPPVQFQQRAVDDDLDSIIYRLVQPESGPQCGPGILIPYDTTYTATNPIPSWTGWHINQNNGVFTLSPYQQGSFVVKIEVEDWRFDPVNLQWLNIGSCVREVQIPITANCNASAQSRSIGLGLQVNSYSPSNLDSLALDSLKQHYQLSDIYKDSALTLVPELFSYSCFSNKVRLAFETPMKANSIKPTDFRLIAPDGSPKPIIGVIDSSNGIYTSEIYLELLNPLVYNGNYLLQLRRGNDGNSLISKCGNEFEEFSVILLPVQGCPIPNYQIDRVGVRQDQEIVVSWSADTTVLRNPGINQYFGGWDLYVSENQGPWILQHTANQKNDSNYVVGFNGSIYPVDHNNYEFFVELRYGGESWGSSNYGESILLEQTGVQVGATADDIELSWNHYPLIPANRRSYLVEYGKYFRVDSVIWLSSIQTNLDSISLSLPKDTALSVYALRITALDLQRQLPNAQSNWVLYNPGNLPISLNEHQSELLIPNVLYSKQGSRTPFLVSAKNKGELGDFSLAVYNTRGELVFYDAEYHKRNQAGSAWTGESTQGNSLPTGMYLYQLEFKSAKDQKIKQLSGRLTILK